MKVYKGTDKDIKCRGYQFVPGETAVEESAKLCSSGFHACEAPIDVLGYYAPGEGSRYFEAELEGVSPERHSDDSKVVGKKITLGAEIGIPGLVKAQIEYVKSHCTTEHTDPKMATAGDSGAATAGSYGAATAGDSGAATAGYSGAATAGYSGAATAGSYGAATAGSYGAATAGYRGAATAGYRGAATAGSYGAATSRGSVSVGENGCALVRGCNIKARGGMGAILVVCVENNEDFNILEYKTIVIDGETYKPNTWYTLKDGKIVEAENE